MEHLTKVYLFKLLQWMGIYDSSWQPVYLQEEKGCSPRHTWWKRRKTKNYKREYRIWGRRKGKLTQEVGLFNVRALSTTPQLTSSERDSSTLSIRSGYHALQFHGANTVQLTSSGKSNHLLKSCSCMAVLFNFSTKTWKKSFVISYPSCKEAKQGEEDSSPVGGGVHGVFLQRE